MDRPVEGEKLANVSEPILEGTDENLKETEETELSIQPNMVNVNEAGMNNNNDQNCIEMSMESSRASTSVHADIEDILKALNDSPNINLQTENVPLLLTESHVQYGHYLVPLTNEDCLLHNPPNQFDESKNCINFSAVQSNDPFCADLPLHDPRTLRFFYNLGLEYFHRVNAMHNFCYLRPPNNFIAEQNPVPANNCDSDNNFGNTDGENSAANNPEKFENDEGKKNMEEE